MGCGELQLKNSGGNSLPSFQALCSIQANSNGDGFFTVESGEMVRSMTFMGGNGGDFRVTDLFLHGGVVVSFQTICTELSQECELVVDNRTSSSESWEGSGGVAWRIQWWFS